MSDYCKCDPRYLADCAYCDGCEYGGETKEKSLSMGNRIQVMIVAQRLYSGAQAATVSLRGYCGRLHSVLPFPSLLLQSAHDTGVFLRQGLSLIVRDRFGDDVEEGTVGIGQNQHPFVSQVNLDAINRFCASLAILLAEDAHDFALVFPGADDVGCAHIICGQVVHNL